MSSLGAQATLLVLSCCDSVVIAKSINRPTPEYANFETFTILAFSPLSLNSSQ